MAQGFYLVLGDMTTCGGKIIEGDPTNTLPGIPVVREGDSVVCGRTGGIFKIQGHIPLDVINGRLFAGTLHSISSCPCGARLIPSIMERTYEV